MSRAYLLDTNTVSYVIKGKSSKARARLEALQPSDLIGISAVTEAELLYGIARSGIGDQRKRLLDWFLLLVTVHPWGRAEAAAYGILRAKQESMGRPLGPLDMQIAAHAVALGAILVTNDKAFHQVPDLAAVENWATDL